MKTAIIFAHYDKYNQISEYVVTYIKELNRISSDIIFVTTSPIDETEIKKIQAYCLKVLVRENIGYDFFSWKFGLNAIEYKKYDRVILANDSCFAPLFPFDSMFKQMESQNTDFWGVTSNREIKFHLQSYFLVFNKSVIHSDCFTDFWDKMQILSSKNEIINNYEIGLTQTLLAHQFTCDYYFKWNIKNFHLLVKQIFINHFVYLRNLVFLYFFKQSKLANYLKKIEFSIRSYKYVFINNPTHFHWRSCLISKIPFIKIELLRDNPLGVSLKNFDKQIKNQTNYNINFILQHLNRFKPAPKSLINQMNLIDLEQSKLYHKLNGKYLIFIPMYNVEKQIPRVLNKLKNMISYFENYKVLLVDNISKDNTLNVAKSNANELNLNYELIQNNINIGLGGSHKVAFQYARDNNYDFLIVLHGDDQGDISDFVKYSVRYQFDPFQYDAFLGGRFMFGSKLIGYSKFRIFGNIVFNLIYTLGSKHIIYDLGAGLNFYNVKSFADNDEIYFPNDLTFNCVMLLNSIKKQQNICFFPIHWSEEDQISNVKLFSQSLKTLKIIYKYVFSNDLFKIVSNKVDPKNFTTISKR